MIINMARKQLKPNEGKPDRIEYKWTGGPMVFHLWKVFVGVRSHYWPDRPVQFHIARMVTKNDK